VDPVVPEFLRFLDFLPEAEPVSVAGVAVVEEAADGAGWSADILSFLCFRDFFVVVVVAEPV
jgi:hypothetical protein